MVSVESDFGGRPDISESLFRIGLVLHIRTFASRPPVAIREQSGCTWHENIESRLPWSLLDWSDEAVRLRRYARRAVHTFVLHPCRLGKMHDRNV